MSIRLDKDIWKKNYIELKFKTFTAAKKKAIEMNQQYGYKPEIFEVEHGEPPNRYFAVIKPKGLKKTTKGDKLK